MINGRGKATKFHASIAFDWVTGDPSTYVSECAWEGTFSSPEAAVAALKTALPVVAGMTPWQPGYLPSIVHLGPRGSVKKVTLERTRQHPSLQAALEALGAQQQ
jgi:hypothetical protein